MNRRILAIGALVAIAIAGLATNGFGLIGGKDDGPLTLYGNVDVREVDLAFRVGGRISSIGVEEGEQVRKGQQLAEIDPTPIDARIAESDAAIAGARAQLAELRNGARAEDVAQASAAVAEANAALRKAEQDVARREPLVAPGAISTEAWQATLAQRDAARARVEQARQAHARLARGARPEQIAAAEAQLRASEAARGSIETDRGDTLLFAPIDGTLITRAEEPGAIVGGGQTVLTLSIDRPLRVRAYVAESDLSRVAPGMKVQVHADGNPRTYLGTIGFISPQAEFTPKTVQTEDLRTDLVYRLRINVTNPDDGLRQGQPVTVIVSTPGGATPPAAGR